MIWEDLSVYNFEQMIIPPSDLVKTTLRHISLSLVKLAPGSATLVCKTETNWNLLGAKYQEARW